MSIVLVGFNAFMGMVVKEKNVTVNDEACLHEMTRSRFVYEVDSIVIYPFLCYSAAMIAGPLH